MQSKAHNVTNYNPFRDWTPRGVAFVYARAAADLLGGDRNPFCPFCVSMVVARTGLGPRTLRRRLVRALIATGNAIARGGAR